jgi:hypothetical protein
MELKLCKANYIEIFPLNIYYMCKYKSKKKSYRSCSLLMIINCSPEIAIEIIIVKDEKFSTYLAKVCFDCSILTCVKFN